jgi:hypothetical protein
VLPLVEVEAEEGNTGVVPSAVHCCSLDPPTVEDHSFGLLHIVDLVCTLVEAEAVARCRVDKTDIVDHRFVDSNPWMSYLVEQHRL